MNGSAARAGVLREMIAEEEAALAELRASVRIQEGVVAKLRERLVAVEAGAEMRQSDHHRPAPTTGRTEGADTLPARLVAILRREGTPMLLADIATKLA